MSIAFPDTPTYTGQWTPFRGEVDLDGLLVEGEVPAVLRGGTYYRVGPDPQWPPLLGDDVLYNGDGMLAMFQFQRNGNVRFRSRYVRTQKFLLERAAGKALYGAYRNRYTDDPSVAGKDRATANTTPLWHGGRMLMLKEDSLPYEVDPVTLETDGRFDYGGRFKADSMSAHPKIDPLTGELLFYSYNAKGDATRDIAFYIANKHGEITKEEWLVAPYASLMHDICATRDYVIFPVMPAIANTIENLKAGQPYWLWDGAKETFLGVLPRNGSARDVRWFRGPARFAFHFANAYQDGSRIVMDGCISEICSAPFLPDVSGKRWDREKGTTQLIRWSLDMAGSDDRFAETVITAGQAALPTFDARYALSKYRYVVSVGPDPYRAIPKVGEGVYNPPYNTLARHDLRTGQVDRFVMDEHTTFGEPQFIPREPAAAELDGYVIVIAERMAWRTELLVMDTRRWTGEAVATIKLPMRIRPAFHTTFVAGQPGEQRQPE